MTDIVLHFRAAIAQDIDVRKGKYVNVSAEGIVGGRAFETRADGSDAQRLASTVGIMFRFRRKDTFIYDRYIINRASVSVENKTELITGSRDFVASYDYDNVEITPFVEHGPLSDGFTIYDCDRLSVESTSASCIVSDFIGTSHG